MRLTSLLPLESVSFFFSPALSLQAVRHLSASKQEEYRRLKQQILEREKLKQQSKAASKSNGGTGSVKVPKSVSSVKQSQTESRELEKGLQQSPAEAKGKSVVDVAKSATVVNASRASVTKAVAANIAKQTNYVHLQAAKTAKKTVPNFSIQITNELIAPAHVEGGKTGENSVEPVNKHQLMSDKQQFRPALRTLSRDEINRKYVQVQLKQDTTERVVTINDKALSSWHDTMLSIGHSDDSVENSNADAEKTANGSNREDGVNDFSNATTVLNSNTSRQELVDSMETTMSRSECEREMNRDAAVSSSPPPPPPSQAGNSSRDDENDAASKSNVMNTGDPVTGNTEDVWNALKRDVKTELESLVRLPKMEQQRYLSDTENKLVARR